MEESHKYDTEREALKQRISMLQEQLRKTERMQIGQETFVKAIRKFMEMKTLTGPLLNELIEKAEVSEAEGSGRNRTQRIKAIPRNSRLAHSLAPFPLHFTKILACSSATAREFLYGNEQ